MKLFHILIKIIQNLSLATTPELQQLKIDVDDWENDAVPESKNKIKSLYGKLHEGVWFRLLSPFLYVFAVSWIKDMLADPVHDDELL